QSILKIHPNDNVIVALRNLKKGETVQCNGETFLLQEDVPAKHKLTTHALHEGDGVYMYGVLVGKAKHNIDAACAITTENTFHAADAYRLRERNTQWHAPDVSRWRNKTFMGFHRSDGSVGTANHWLVVPLVFCENRNVQVLREALLEELGYARPKKYHSLVKQLHHAFANGEDVNEIDVAIKDDEVTATKLFNNVDGIKFLLHDGGCGGTRQDAEALCGLLAGYITHANVAGATVLSLGCQHSQVSILMDEIKKRSPQFDKPLFVIEQQQVGLEKDVLAIAIKKTFEGLIKANECKRMPAPLSKLCIGLECGGSDGFSGISANPAIGYTSDLLVALGGTVLLSEFPELCGVEQELSDRCIDENVANRFMQLMTTYNNRAKAVGSGFDMNPSPGNIKDGLITDAIKSAGAAKKGGTSPVTAVLDYPEKATQPGLNLLCTPGNDVESTTAEVGSGCNIVLFTTGLGTPTGNPIAPVIKLSTNTALYNKMPDIIDINTGAIIDGDETIEQAGERILEYVIKVASGEEVCAAVRHGQDDFIVWKRGVSL
ncbi:MAG TPA: altronate dehydratase family protein, partial [Chitinophagaceae bacterium]|nr:altronate dehydratase family protein [Chitinophagaceae bacterium]